MAYPITTGTIIELGIAGTLFAQRTLTLFHYRLTGTTVTDGEAALEEWLSSLTGNVALGGAYFAACSEDWTGYQLSAQVIFVPGPSVQRRPKVVMNISTYEGEVASPSLPPGVAVALTRRSEVATRRGVGTIHMPAVPTSYTANGSLNSTGLADYTTFGDACMENPTIGTLTGVPLIYNRTAPVDSIQVTSVTPQSTLRTMRRRVVGRGI